MSQRDDGLDDMSVDDVSTTTPIAPLLYGGTFDPVHDGHLAVARAVAKAAEQKVYLMPAALPPHRVQPGASDHQRLAMLERAIAGETRLGIDDRELRRVGASYSVLSLRECVTAGQRPALILGWDAFCGIPSWREPEAILTLAVLIVLPRPQATVLPALLQACWGARRELSADALKPAREGDVLFCTMPEQPISATAIRAAIRAGVKYPEGLPRAVADYIDEQKLYAN